MEDLIKKINDLANKSKTQGLTTVEEEEQKKLREEYLNQIRGQVKNQLASVKIVNEEGQDVTPNKLKDLKNNLNQE